MTPPFACAQDDICLECHADQEIADPKGRSVYVNAQQYKSSKHGQADIACVDCHRDLAGLKDYPHPYPLQRVRCVSCHPGETDAYAAGPHGRSRAAGNLKAPACVDCHGDAHSITRLVRGENTCQKCHPGPAEQIVTSVHGEVFAQEESPYSVCYICHTGHRVYQQRGRKRTTCGGCHKQIEQDYETSLHGYALAQGIKDAPNCTGCHDNHHILAADNVESPISRRNVHKTCGKCHGEKPVMTEGLIRFPRAAWTYETSVHGQAVSRGLEKAATCLDCHGDHSLKGAGDPTSKINISNIANTCGQCHPHIKREYLNSIHGRALRAGISDSPTCTGCHGEHQIMSPESPQSPTSPAHQAEETCARCHNDPRIINKYGMEGTVVETYEDSYHGLAIRGKSKRAATCCDCHTSHNVQPKADSTSTVFVDNVKLTCQKCHPGATTNFALSYTHASLGKLESPINAVVRNIYIFVLVFIIGGMVAHNVLILNWHMIRAKRREKRAQTVIRFDKIQILQHLVLTFTFIGLAVTGFALKFPEVWWVKALNYLGLVEEVRGTLHRIFAVFLVVFGIFHIGYIIVNRRGREELQALLPRWKDVQDLKDNILFYAGLRKHRPAFGQYDYSQKGEYWALVWGTVLMALTGFILWFPVKFLSFLPGWTIEVAQTVHYYEAWLATLAIVVWHFFFVIFHPEVYPMNWTWLTGKINVRDIRTHHPLWYLELRKKGVIGSKAEVASAESNSDIIEDKSAGNLDQT